jgi:hypothetical protein
VISRANVLKMTVGGAIVLACVTTPSADAQNVEYGDAISRRVLLVNNRPVEYTDAISRRILMVNVNSGVEFTDAISRQVLLVNTHSVDFTDAISRQMLLVNVNSGVEYPDANSRQVLLYVPPYAAADLRNSLNIVAGLLAATQANMDRLNITRDGESAASIDMRDATRIARMAMGLDP